MWDLILNPFITVLTLLYSVFGNSPVIAIILFTILIRLLTYPLTAQQMRSSKAMQQLQPRLKQIQEKYKNDRERLSQEQMKLYREAGVNPLGGCLPVFIQLPIWIGLYQAINHALAATPLQLLDLSGRFLVPGLDRLVPLNNVWLGIDLTQSPGTNPVYAYIFPVLVLITSYIQGKMITPSAPPSEDGKPNQAAAMTQSMSTMMPIMMGLFSLSFSVGLSVYFVASNLLGIFQYARGGNFQWRNLMPFSRPSAASAPKPALNAGGKTTLKAKLEAERGAQLSNSETIEDDEVEVKPEPKAATNGARGAKAKSSKTKPAK
jgi:YidC/Oxa1 family membrane protein insertase